MLGIFSENNDPYFNLAAEEFLLRNTREEIFILWQSIPAVVVGKHQNALAEINYRYTTAQGIAVARRLSGGGTVYHDNGNINFTIIRQGEPGKLVDFTGFIEPVIRFMKISGVDAEQGLKHEILTRGKKISGNAGHVFKNRVLHHGTLLFNSDMEMLHESIRHTGGIYTDKAVQSNRSSVINVAECIRPLTTLEEFKKAFFSFILDQFGGSRFILDNSLIGEIQKMADEKYRTWDWIYGWSPDYTFRNTWKDDAMEIEIELATHRGNITYSNISSSYFDNGMLKRINRMLNGTAHKESRIREVMVNTGLLRPDDNRFDDLVMAFF